MYTTSNIKISCLFLDGARGKVEKGRWPAGPIVTSHARKAPRDPGRRTFRHARQLRFQEGLELAGGGRKEVLLVQSAVGRWKIINGAVKAIARLRRQQTVVLFLPVEVDRLADPDLPADRPPPPRHRRPVFGAHISRAWRHRSSHRSASYVGSRVGRIPWNLPPSPNHGATPATS